MDGLLGSVFDAEKLERKTLAHAHRLGEANETVRWDHPPGALLGQCQYNLGRGGVGGGQISAHLQFWYGAIRREKFQHLQPLVLCGQSVV